MPPLRFGKQQADLSDSACIKPPPSLTDTPALCSMQSEMDSERAKRPRSGGRNGKRSAAVAVPLERVLGVKLRCARQSGKVNFHFASGQLLRLPAIAGNGTVVYSPPPRIPENFPVPSVISKLPGAGATRE